jgi:NADH-quinone oxidoreductase subunit M
MMLLYILFLPVVAGVLALLSERVSGTLPGWVAFLGLSLDFGLVISLWAGGAAGNVPPGHWISQFQGRWIPEIGITFHLAADSISLLLLALTTFLGSMAALASFAEIKERRGFFYLCVSWTIAGIIGVFLALDLFLFYFAWEFMLVPMFLLILLWGHEDRFRAGVKFFIFTQLGGLLMLAAILGLYFAHGRVSGTYTFDYEALVGTAMGARAGSLVLCGFLAAFLVKLPAVPFHTWLPDAHTQAPTGGSVILAGLLLKTGAYGVLRFAIPLFPVLMQRFSTVLEILGLIGILYGALLAFAQQDMKRLIAYTSVSHMGFVLLGLLSGSSIAFQGAMVQILSHGLSTGALFVLVGALQERLQTRDLSRMGGLWSAAPRLGGATMLFALAGLGLPGMGNFVGEFLVVLGTYKSNPVMAIVAALGFILSTIYTLRMMARAFFGENRVGWRIHDLSVREGAIMALMVIPLFWLGLYPRTFTDLAIRPAVSASEEASGQTAPTAPEAPEDAGGQE